MSDPTPDRTSEYQELLLAPRARLVHIGAPKTGTTALQNAAHTLRAQLRQQGVNYPGRELNHQRPTSVLIGRPADAWGGELPPEKWWSKTKQEIDADTTRRIFLSFELICQADTGGVQRVFDEIGPDLHAVLVVRNFGQLLPSMWQQTVKMGSTKSLDDFLRTALEDPTAVKIPGSEAFHRSDGRNLIERWCEVIGPERFTVVVLDPAHPDILFDAFEGMLGLPSGLLATASDDGHRSNRSMSAAEVELFRRVNSIVLGQWRADKLYHRQLIWMGAIDRMLANRTPTSDEGKVRLPEWAAGAAQEAGAHLAAAIRTGGVRVVGELEGLDGPVPTMPDDGLRPPDRVPTDLTVEALLGMFARAVGVDAFHQGEVPSSAPRPLRHPGQSAGQSPPAAPSPSPATGTLVERTATLDLARILAQRIAERVGRGLRVARSWRPSRAPAARPGASNDRAGSAPQDQGTTRQLSPRARPVADGWAERVERDGHLTNRLMAEVLGPASSFVDIGTNRAQILRTAVRLAPDGQHVAFEPIPDLARQLRRRFPAVTTHEMALSDHEGRAAFFVVEGREAWSGLRPQDALEGHRNIPIEVDVRTLDSIRLPARPTILKIDVEGGELAVLVGARATTTRFRPFILFEHASLHADAYGFDAGTLFDELQQQHQMTVFSMVSRSSLTRAEFSSLCEYSRASGYGRTAETNFIAAPTELVSQRSSTDPSSSSSWDRLVAGLDSDPNR